MNTHVVIDPATNTVVNRIVAEPGFELDGYVLVADEAAQIGWTWDGEVLSPPAVSFEDRVAAMRAAVNAKLNSVLTGGYSVESGTMAGKVLQTRNLEDRTNWLISRASYSAAVAAGMGATTGATFRTADNSTFTVTFAEGLSVLLAMAAWGAAAMNNSWSLKDAIATAGDGAALDAIDIDAGWPE